MKYGSVCSGIESATAAWHGLGWRPAFFSEIEAFPSAVLKHHYPEVENRGDMTRFKEWPDERIDVLVGGTPCQSFSVAGLRKGLADPRGNLALVFLAIADRLRPKWVVWENVSGVLSQDEGRAFGSIVGGLGELGYGWAYRILDAQYFGVPQRRERVFLVGHLGDWRRAAAVLFERHSLSGHPAPRRQAGKGASTDLAPSLVSSGRGVERTGDIRGQDPVIAVTHALKGEGFDGSEDGTGRGTPIVPALVSNGDAHSGFRDANGLVAFDTTQVTSKANRSNPKPGDPCHPLAAGVHAPLAVGVGVRRLTPRECERLQGFPDDYTLVTYRRKPAKDGPRYKALGNSMARPVMEWLGRRIDLVTSAGR